MKTRTLLGGILNFDTVMIITDVQWNAHNDDQC